jgi:hypothetical protein
VCCAQPTQVPVLYDVKELTIESSSKVKARKVYLPRESKWLLLPKPDTPEVMGKLFLLSLCPPGQLFLGWGLPLS